MFPVICKKTPAMWHVGLWEQSASSSHGMNVSASRCVLLTSRSTTDLNACGFEGCPARVTNSISPLSYRTLRPWRSVPSGHPLHPSSRQQRENPRTDQVTATAGAGSKSHPTVQSKAPTDKAATFSTASVNRVIPGQVDGGPL
jgi:hypothetical protein